MNLCLKTKTKKQHKFWIYDINVLFHSSGLWTYACVQPLRVCLLVYDIYLCAYVCMILCEYKLTSLNFN